MEKELTIDAMFTGLIKGDTYVLKKTLQNDWQSFKSGKFRYFVPGDFDSIYLSDDIDGTPIFKWQHYGSSANKATKDNLKWLLETIFKRDASEFVKLDYDALLNVINNYWH